MKLNFCTLFDSNYLSRGLTMYDSLVECCNDFHLYVFAFDQLCLEALKKIDKPNLTAISLQEFEDEALLKVKPSRSIAEYCWTSTPSTVLYAIKTFNLEHCTYIDADMLFYSNPIVLIEEMGDRSVSIISHRFTPKYREAEVNGKYCVQFMTFKNTKGGLEVLNWWRNACLDWCYARVEEGKFGDQKYLDSWSMQFPNSVIELENIGGGVAPWNVEQYRILITNNFVEIEDDKGKRFPMVFYHFHGLKLMNTGSIILTLDYFLSKKVKDCIYLPYLKRLEAKRVELKSEFGIQKSTESYQFKPFWKLFVKKIIWRLKGLDNFIK